MGNNHYQLTLRVAGVGLVTSKSLGTLQGQDTISVNYSLCAMAPDSGLPPIANEFGLKVINNLENFSGELKGVKDQMTSFDKSLQEVRIKAETIDGKLSALKDGADSHTKKLDIILDRGSDIKSSLASIDARLSALKEDTDTHATKIESIIAKEADIKASLASMGMKTNLNLIGIFGGIATLLVIFNHTFSLANNARSTGSDSSPASKTNK